MEEEERRVMRREEERREAVRRKKRKKRKEVKRAADTQRNERRERKKSAKNDIHRAAEKSTHSDAVSFPRQTRLLCTTNKQTRTNKHKRTKQTNKLFRSTHFSQAQATCDTNCIHASH